MDFSLAKRSLVNGIYWYEKNGGSRLLMPIPRLLKPWCKIKVEAELHFLVMMASLWQPCPASCDTKTGRSSKGWIPISLLSTGILFPYLIWFEYVSHFLFSSAKKSQSKTHFIYRSFLFLEKTKPQSLNAVSMWLQIMVEVFGKMPGRLFLEEKHQHFFCGTLIGNRMVV